MKAEIEDIGATVTMRRPGVKPEHAPYRISGNRIRIGGVTYGIAAEIKDPTGSVWTMLARMDVVRSPRDCDVLLLAADWPPEVRIWTNRSCIATGRPWVDAVITVHWCRWVPTKES